MMYSENNAHSLQRMVERGGVYYQVSGGNPTEVLSALVGLLPPVPLERGALLQAALEREALISTGIGRGIALPHPRAPLLDEDDDPFVALAFPAKPVDWSTQDGSKVHTIFLIVSNSVKQHLTTLSKINFLCQQEKFKSLIKAQASKEQIIGAIHEAETAWAGT